MEICIGDKECNCIFYPYTMMCVSAVYSVLSRALSCEHCGKKSQAYYYASLVSKTMLELQRSRVRIPPEWSALLPLIWVSLLLLKSSYIVTIFVWGHQSDCLATQVYDTNFLIFLFTQIWAVADNQSAWSELWISILDRTQWSTHSWILWMVGWSTIGVQ